MAFVSAQVEKHHLLETLAHALFFTLDAAAFDEDNGRVPALCASASTPQTPEQTRSRRRLESALEAAAANGGMGDDVVRGEGSPGEDVASAAAAEDTEGFGRVVSMTHPVLLHRRYSPIIADLKCVLNIDGVAEQFVSTPTCLKPWLGALSRVHGIDAQRRRGDTDFHVEYESRDWMFAFNVNISLSSVFDFAAAWVRRAAALDTARGAAPSTVTSAVSRVSTLVESTLQALRVRCDRAASGHASESETFDASDLPHEPFFGATRGRRPPARGDAPSTRVPNDQARQRTHMTLVECLTGDDRLSQYE